MAWELTTWKPYRDVERVRGEMDRLWDSFFEGRPNRELGTEGEWLPALDVAETKNDIVVKAEMPGLNPKDIDIALSEGMLTIKGEKKQEAKAENGRTFCHERFLGKFGRNLQLPEKVHF